ncbi:ATP-grasp domain-containing protein [Streptomyces werraensis]|uniref:ATP-grasp domain-containing protein n=1 Tax=Streptomyces werraensis TaxID=68284 RepID=UPI00382F3BF1
MSALEDDLNRDTCDDHVVLDWDSDDPTARLAELERELRERDVQPVAVINMVEALIAWQVRIAERYGLPGAEPSRRVLLSKAALRSAMSEAGLSNLPWVTGSAAGLDADAVDFFPAVAKPSRESGASRFVRRVDGAEDLREHLAEIAGALGPDAEVIVEGFIKGMEFSIDGMVFEGHFNGLVAFEKADYDDALLHDAGLSVCPPQQPAVKAGVEHLSQLVTRLCGHLGLHQGWLHVEGRALEDGTAELIEINPRPGRGTHLAAIQYLTGIDPVEVATQTALPEGWSRPAVWPPQVGDEHLVGMVPISADRLGRVVASSSQDELLAVPGVFAGYLLNGYRVESLNRENIVAEAAFIADDVPGLRAVADAARRAVRFDVVAD